MDKIVTKIEGMNKVLKGVISLVGSIILICTSVYLTIDRTFEAKVAEFTAELSGRITDLEKYIEEDIITNILNQAKKINAEEFNDVRIDYINAALKFYPLLHDPTEQVMLAYEVIKQYYINHLL